MNSCHWLTASDAAVEDIVSPRSAAQARINECIASPTYRFLVLANLEGPLFLYGVSLTVWDPSSGSDVRVRQSKTRMSRGQNGSATDPYSKPPASSYPATKP